MTRCRLVALDVDGTLMSYDGVISDEVTGTIGDDGAVAVLHSLLL